MRIKPTTVLEAFKAAKNLSAQAGFKIFTPSNRYFRDEHQFIGANNAHDKSGKSIVKKNGIFRIWIHRNSLYIEFYPFHENRAHLGFLEKELETKIKQRRYRAAMRRFDITHKMVSAAQHAEFDQYIGNIRLP
jgi:hypothetical protein